MTQDNRLDPQTQASEQPHIGRFTYNRGRDGVDDTWDIYDPYGKFVVSICFWDDGIDDSEALETEARAKLIVETLNEGYWW